MMPDLYSYTDYRKFLQDHLEQRKAAGAPISLRSLARRLGIDPGNLVKMFNRDRHLSDKGVGRAIAYFKFGPREGEYFTTLVAFGKARKESRIRELFARLAAMKQVRPFEITGAMAEFYRTWYHSAVCGLLAIIDFTGDCAALARLCTPPVSAAQVRRSIALLKKLGLVSSDARGFLRPVQDMLSTGDKWHAAAIHEFQRQTLELSLRALREMPKKERDISTVSFAVSDDDVEEIRALADDFRKSVLRIAKNSETPARVYQLNMQLFPLSSKKAGRQR